MAAEILTSTKDMPREEWLEHRRSGIGGSDTPVIVLGNDHPFTSPRELWEQKVGIRKDDEPTPPMLRGTALEPTVATLYAGETERKLQRVNSILQHPDHHWMIGNIDRQIVGVKGRNPGILEIKCPGLRTFGKIKREGIPDYYQLQMQHYFAVSGRTWGAFAIFNAEMWELIHFDVERDDELIELIIERDEAFWQMVQDGTPPGEKALTNPDIPPLQTGTELVRIDSQGWSKAVEDLRTAREILGEAKEIEDSAKERLQNLMTTNGASAAEGSGLRAYWYEQAGRQTFDHKRFSKAHPELAEAMKPYFKQGDAFRAFRPYFLKEGTRHE